jgi:hypothetical protein
LWQNGASVSRKTLEGNGMLLQTNSYIVPKEKRADHARLMRRFRQTLLRLGCDHFEVYEQVGANWSNAEVTGRYVQILRFVDRKHQLAVQAAERSDPTAQGVIAEFCDLINFPYQQQQGLFAVGFYTSVLPMSLLQSGSGSDFAATVDSEMVEEGEPNPHGDGVHEAEPTNNHEPTNEHELIDETGTELAAEPSLEADEHVENHDPEHHDIGEEPANR